jgi:serine/threonine-protein kinase
VEPRPTLIRVIHGTSGPGRAAGPTVRVPEAAREDAALVESCTEEAGGSVQGASVDEAQTLRLDVRRHREGTTSREAEDAAHLQHRLRLIAGVMAVVVGALFLAIKTVDVAVHGGDLAHLHFEEAATWVQIVIWPIFLALYLLLRRQVTVPYLRVVDALLFYVPLCGGILVIHLAPWEDVPFVFSILTLFVVTRAVVVPSSPARTLWLALPLVPLLLLAILARPAWGQPGTSAADHALECSLYVIIFALSTALATLTSRVTYSLRRQVDEATRLGPYALGEKIGEGAMGEVYRATHALLKRPTAIKLLRPEITGIETLRRFEREVQQTSRLTHPNTVSIYDYGHTPEGVFYYAMELLDGVDLHEMVARHGPMPAARAIHVLAQVCAALNEAHRLGLIHRDIKPGNVFLCRRGDEHDVAKVLDFGLVKDIRQSNPSMTEDGVFVGTPETGAPESFFGGSATPASDLYSVGAVGYYLVTGRMVFEAPNVVQIVQHHAETPPRPPSRRRTGVDVPEDLERVILHCLEKDPRHRPPSAADLRRELLDCADAPGWDAARARDWWEAHAPADQLQAS